MKALLLIPAAAALTAIAVYVIDAERSYRRLAKHLGADHSPVYQAGVLTVSARDFDAMTEDRPGEVLLGLSAMLEQAREAREPGEPFTCAHCGHTAHLIGGFGYDREPLCHTGERDCYTLVTNSGYGHQSFGCWCGGKVTTIIPDVVRDGREADE